LTQIIRLDQDLNLVHADSVRPTNFHHYTPTKAIKERFKVKYNHRQINEERLTCRR